MLALLYVTVIKKTENATFYIQTLIGERKEENGKSNF